MILSQAIAWLDTFQRSRRLEGDVIVLGIGDGEVMLALGSQVQAGERFVIVDEIDPGVLADAKRSHRGKDLIIINETPASALKSEAMEMEHGQYRLVSCGELEGSDPLLCPGGVIVCGPVTLVAHPLSLYHVGNVGKTMFLTNDLTWRDDYRRILAAVERKELS